MKCVISRTYNKNETLGTLSIWDGEKPVWNCKTIELPDNGNRRNFSCIPEGIYDTIKFMSPTRGECFHVLNVPDRDAILIHPGNFVAGRRVDTKGCILPGSYFFDINNDGNIDIAESRKTMDKLLTTLPDSFKLIII